MRGQLVLSVEGSCREGVEQLSRREAFFSLLNYQLPFLNHVHQLDAGEGVLCGIEGLEPEHRTGDPLHATMVLLHHIIQLFHLADDDGGPVLLVVRSDGRGIGLTPIDGNLLRHAVAADRLLQKP
jgi:hypothetical protein